jgi:hypothetical protein
MGKNGTYIEMVVVLHRICVHNAVDILSLWGQQDNTPPLISKTVQWQPPGEGLEIGDYVHLSGVEFSLLEGVSHSQREHIHLPAARG